MFLCVLFICVQHLVSAVVVLKCFINKVELSWVERHKPMACTVPVKSLDTLSHPHPNFLPLRKTFFPIKSFILYFLIDVLLGWQCVDPLPLGSIPGIRTGSPEIRSRGMRRTFRVYTMNTVWFSNDQPQTRPRGAITTRLKNKEIIFYASN